MKIINTTKWETKHLRAFISEVMKRSPEYIKRKFIAEKYRKRLVCHARWELARDLRVG